MQGINYRSRERLQAILNMPEKAKTTLIEWFEYNNANIDGRHLPYLDFPSKFVWYQDSKSWSRRVIRTRYSIERLTYVHLSSGELFFFRMLLCHQKGCKSPIDVRTINDQIFLTYRVACKAFGLLGNDREWDIALEEATVTAPTYEIRFLFAQILIYCNVADPPRLWATHWQAIADDIPAKVYEQIGIPEYHVNTAELQRYILYEIEAPLNGFRKFVKDFGLPTPPAHLLEDLKNKLLIKEMNYKRDLLRHETL
ncbi:hypothetical protein Tco_0791429 [Tanacetum coccineum]